MKYDYQLIIVGAGSGGLAMIKVTHGLGLKRIALVEKSKRLGGECLHTGCVPSKALLHAAKNNYEDPWGHVRKSIATIEEDSDNDEQIKKLGIDVFHGPSSFTDPHTLQVGDQTISSKFFLLAPGSQPFVPPIPGLEDVEYYTNETLFELNKTPKRLGIIGGGPIGIEMATAFSALGSAVDIFERSKRILSRMDADASAVITESLKSAGASLHTQTTISNVAKKGSHIQLTTEDNTTHEVDALLVAVGRVPTTNLNLEAAGVVYDKKGITIDHKLRTTAKHIYAIGDATPSPKFTHLAAHQASVALTNMLTPIKMSAKRLQPTPAITYSWPEVGSFGMSEEKAMQKRGARKIVQTLTDNDRAITDDATTGFIKLVVTRWGRILHCTVVANNASELLSPLLILYVRKRSILELAYVVIPYPTMANALTSIAADFSTGFVQKLPGWKIITRNWR